MMASMNGGWSGSFEQLDEFLSRRLRPILTGPPILSPRPGGRAEPAGRE